MLTGILDGTVGAAPRVPTTVEFTPPVGTVIQKGTAPVRFTATVRDQDGDVMDPTSVEMEFVNPSANVRVALDNTLLNFVDIEMRPEAVVGDPWSIEWRLPNT